MKKKLALFLTLVLLLALFAGCKNDKDTQPSAAPQPSESVPTPPPDTAAPQPVETQPEGEPFRFTRENFPRLDGSTACIPLGEAVCSVLLGETREEVQDLVVFNRTTQSFRNLMNGECDLLIAGEPNASVFEEMDEAIKGADFVICGVPNAAVYDEMKENGFEADIATFGRDGLVFLVNESNPVDNLTTDQIRAIYTGEITNWKEVGGEDAEIIPIQRNEGAGSQALMKKLVMKDTPLMDAPEEYVPGSMGELMSVVKSYDGSANAIGYSVYYYANDMQMAKGLKLLKVDGVEPNRETIRSQEYPHLNAYYSVVAKSSGAGTPARVLFDWLVTEDGQRLIAQEGYVSVLEG